MKSLTAAATLTLIGLTTLLTTPQGHAMPHVQGRIRDYNPAADTCSIELDGYGVIDTWLDSVPIDPAVNRAYIRHGGRCTLSVVDEQRLDELTMVATADKPTTPLHYQATGQQTDRTGRQMISTDGTGAGSASILYSPAYATAPQDLQITCDNNRPFTLSLLTATGFTITISGGPANSFVGCTWHATG